MNVCEREREREIKLKRQRECERFSDRERQQEDQEQHLSCCPSVRVPVILNNPHLVHLLLLLPLPLSWVCQLEHSVYDLIEQQPVIRVCVCVCEGGMKSVCTCRGVMEGRRERERGEERRETEERDRECEIQYK